MALEKPYTKLIRVDGETIEPSDHNKQETQLEALTVFGNRTWDTAGRPTPAAGDLYPMGFNTDLLVYEFWNGSAWVQLGSPEWEHIKTERLSSPANIIALNNLSCGLASGGAKYRAIKLWMFLKAETGSISNPIMEANEDTTGTNYYGAGGANDARIYNGSILLGTNNYWFEGMLIRSNAFAAETDAYHWSYYSLVDVDGGAFASANRTDDGWKWLNPATSDDVLNDLDIKAPTNNWEVGSQATAFGMRPGV
jgi:hypothetical protein